MARTAGLVLAMAVAIGAWAPTAVAEDERSAPELVAALDAVVGDAGSGWLDRWKAYKAWKDRDGKLAKKGEAGKAERTAGKEAYEAIKDKVVAALSDADAEGAPESIELVRALGAVTANEDSSWGERWKAYKAFKARGAKLKGDESEGAKAETGGAEVAYVAIRKQVADKLRRSTLPATGWLMGFFAASLLWGGFAVCVAIAMKAGKRARNGDGGAAA